MEDIGLATINYYNLDEECELNYVPNEAVKIEINDALSNGREFGRHNAILAYKKFIK
jgi:3-oxoacyl-[acyl-carrier-protein] synthase II